MANTVLERLLDDNARFDVGGRGTVNHLPMALVALSRLGGDDRRLGEYFAWWEANKALPRRDSGRAVTRTEWRQYLGDGAMFDALATCFREWIIEHGRAEVIDEVFPTVVPGVAAAAFHGLIRLAYGIEAEHAGEVGAGLAVLCARYAPLDAGQPAPRPSGSAAASLAGLSAALGGATFTGQGIIGRMQAAVADPRFAAGFSAPPIGPGLFGELAQAAIALYWQTGDFTALHMVTATHAARVVLGRFPQLATEDAVAALWLAACAAYASIGAPALREAAAAPVELPPWPEIFRQAAACDDDHVIKMTYTCHCEAGHYGGALYHAAAARLAAAGKA